MPDNMTDNTEWVLNIEDTVAFLAANGRKELDRRIAAERNSVDYKTGVADGEEDCLAGTETLPAEEAFYALEWALWGRGL